MSQEQKMCLQYRIGLEQTVVLGQRYWTLDSSDEESTAAVMMFSGLIESLCPRDHCGKARL